MGVDVSILIGHRLKMHEVLTLPTIMAAWTDVEEAVTEYVDEFPRILRDPEDDLPRWDMDGYALTEEDVLQCWAYWEAEDDDVPMGNVFTIDIKASFGRVHVNRHTLHIIPHQHKWANMRDAYTRAYFIDFSRKVAQHLGQRKVLYCVDSAFPQSHLEDFAYSGWKIDAIEDYGNAQFGTPPREWDDEAVNFYFVDRDW
ncbi:MAG: hypothetical protein U0176_21045 [Bacteroidia bacterium]